MVYHSPKGLLLEDNYAVSSEDLVAGLTRSSGAAKVLGLTLDETIGILTVMREATGRTGKEVGNALNSILSFMQRPTAIKAFEAEGIRVFADEARTQFRNVIELFDEMSAKWPTMSVEVQDIFSEQAEQVGLYSEEMAEAIGLQKEWTDIQQRDLSQAAAGIYRRNYLLALLQNWAKVDEVIIGLEDSLGYSMRENERTMATLEKQIESLKAAAEQFAVSIGDAGLLDQMKGLVEGTTDVIKWFNDLDDTTKTLLVTFGEVAIAIKLLTSLMKMMGLSGAGALAGGLLKGWNMPIKLAEASKAMITLRTATTATTTALRNLGTGAVAALGGPWVLGITAAAAAVYTLYKEVKAANATMIEHGVLAENMVGDYDALVNKLSQLEKGTEDYNKTAEELRVQKEQISKALPEVVDGYDAETNSLIINRKAMDDVIDAGKEMKKSLDEKNKSLENAIELEDEEIQASQSRAREWESQKNILEELAQRRKDLIDVLARQAKGSEDAQKTEEALGETEKLIADIAVEAGLKRNASVDEIIAKIGELIKAQDDAATKHYENQRKMVEDARQGALDRMEILNQEIAANKSLLPGGKWYKDMPGFLKGKYNILPGGEFWARRDLKEKQESLIQTKADLDDYNRQLAEIDKSVQSIKNAGNKSAVDDITGGNPPPPGGSGTGKSIDYIAEALKRLTDAAKQYDLVNMDLESALQAVSRGLGVADAEFSYLNGKIESGTATLQDYARMQELVAQKSAYLKSEQMQLADANKVYQTQIDALSPVLAKAMAEYDRFKAAGDEKHMKDAASAVSALKSEIDSLSGSIASNTQKMWENKDTLANLTDSAEKSNRAIRDANIKSLKDEIDYLTRDGASQQELSRAYGRQADYIRLLNEQRDDLNKRIGESQKIISELTHAQSQLNTSTEEGKLSYDQYGQAIANATSKLADLKSQQIQVNSAIDEGKDAIVKRNLAELDRLHKAHLMTLEQYIQALGDLERQYGSVMSVSQQWTIDLAQSNSLLQKWTDDINSALEKARKSFEVEMKRIDEVISQTQKELSDFKDAITRIFDGIDKSTSRNFSKDILDSIPGLLPRTFVGNQSYLDYVSSILTGSSGPGKLRSSLSDVGMTVSEIFAGKYMPVGNETDTTTTTPIYPDTAYIDHNHGGLWERTMESLRLNPEHYNAAIATWLESNPVFLKWLADNDASNSQANRSAFMGTNEGFKEFSDNFSYVGPAGNNPNIMVHVEGGSIVGLDIPWSMTGEAAPTAQTTFDLSKEDFLAALKTNVEGLSQASTQIDDALANVDAWRESEVNRIDGLIEAKQLKLQQDIELLDGLFDQLDKSAQKFERTQTKERFQRSLNAAMGIESPIGVVPTAGDLQSLFNNLPTINLDNLMTFDPTNFKNAVTQGLTTLEDARQTATGYIQSLADSTKAQIAVIDAELKALDEESQKDTRGDAEEAHNKRLEELAEKRRYHEVRTGLEHVEAIADIDKQIAEENESWAKKQRDWGKEDKKAELQDKKASLQETQALLTQALQDLIGYINSEIQARKEATQEYKSNLQDQVQGEIKALNDEKAIAVQRAELLTEMLTGLKTFVTDALTQWKKLADDRVDITTKEVNDIIKLYEGQKETLKGIWEDNESGIRSMMQSGTLAQLAMMAALGKADGSAVQDLVNAITDKGIRESLQPIISRITGIAAPTPTPITPTPTPNPQPGGGNTHPDDGKTPATPWKHIANVNSSNPYLKNSNGNWYASREIWESPSMGYSVGWDAASKRMIIDGKAVSTIIDNNGKGYAQIREYFEGIGRTVKWNESRKRIDIYHEGGTITPFGRKPLLSDEVPIIARHNEMIFPDVPKYRVGIDFKRMQDTLEQVSKPNRSGALVNAAVIDKAADRIIKAIKEKAGVTVGKLVNVEHYEPQDSTDVEIFSREVMRRVAQL